MLRLFVLAFASPTSSAVRHFAHTTRRCASVHGHGRGGARPQLHAGHDRAHQQHRRHQPEEQGGRHSRPTPDFRSNRSDDGAAPGNPREAQHGHRGRGPHSGRGGRAVDARGHTRDPSRGGSGGGGAAPHRALPGLGPQRAPLSVRRVLVCPFCGLHNPPVLPLCFGCATPLRAATRLELPVAQVVVSGAK